MLADADAPSPLRSVLRASRLALAISGLLVPSALAQCEGWESGFGHPGIDGLVRTAISHDDGHGPALFLGGGFRIAGDVVASRVVRWDGASWSRVGAGLDFEPGSFEVYDDGSGAALYAASSTWPQARLSRWDGTSWTTLASFDGVVSDLHVHDDGAGSALYAAGLFTQVNGVAASHLARWDGSSWSSVGGGLDGNVTTLTTFDDGGGPALYAGGWFTSAGGVSAQRIARWSGTAWSGLGGGTTLLVSHLVGFDDGSGPKLYIDARQPSPIGGYGYLLTWDGTNWGSIAAFGGVPNASAWSLVVHDDGSGAALYVGGSFGAIEDPLTGSLILGAPGVARWDGTSWSGLAGGLADGIVAALAVHDEGSGPALFAGGSFESSGALHVPAVARWSSSAWSALDARNDGIGRQPAPATTSVRALQVFDDGSGPALYAGGSFFGAGTTAASNVARWDGASWSAVGLVGVDASVASLAAFDDGGGPALHAGGQFFGASTGLLRWDGTSWTVAAGGLLPGGDVVLHAASAAFGGGLYVGGTFAILPGLPRARRIARWDGAAWTALGGGIDAISGGGSRVDAIAEWNAGGASLVVAGRFDKASGVPARNVAAWNGAAWSPLGPGLDQRVHALAVFDDGQGPALYAGGEFLQAGGVPASRIARWDGASWSAVAGGCDGPVIALVVHDDGAGPALYAAGDFANAGGAPARRIARYDGTGWSALGGGLSSGSVEALATFDDGQGGGTRLCAGGSFVLADDEPSSRFAIWSGCAGAAPLSDDTPDAGEAELR